MLMELQHNITKIAIDITIITVVTSFDTSSIHVEANRKHSKLLRRKSRTVCYYAAVMLKYIVNNYAV